MTLPLETWWLPRPSKSKYKGSFPLNFESMLFKRYPGMNVLQPFGGKAIIGTRCDINSDVKPDYICDAHELPFNDNSEYDFILLDPPYNDKYSKELYGSGPLKKSRYVAEAVRVCKPGGFVAHYDIVLNPRPHGTSYDRIITIITRVYHKPRICAVYRKD